MIVLDTNVVSELMILHPSRRVLDWVRRQAPQSLYLTSVSEAELRCGAEVLPKGRRRTRLRDAIDGLVQEDFTGRILPFDRDAARAYALIAAARCAAGRPISYADAQIAAITRSVGAAVATRDAGGFEGCGVEVIDPWSEE